jgi:hypothetical protein
LTKITRFRDVPQFTRTGSWECDFDPKGMLAWIDEHVENYGLDLDPDFQRGHVWSKEQQIRYIEFFLKGGRTARVIYLNDPNWVSKEPTATGHFVLVDGKQRLQAWRCFLDNKIAVFGSYYREFTDSLRMTQTMKINVNDLKTRREVLQWYLDFNSGGVVHSTKEIAKVQALLEQEPA